MVRIRRNKKGASIDNIWTAIVFFGLAIFFVALMIMWNAFNTQMDDVWEGSSKGLEIKDNAQRAVNQFDWILVVVWVGFHLGILATAFLLRTHPVIYIVAILITAIIALIAAPLSNAYADMAEDTELTTAMNSLPMTKYILDNFPKLEIIWALVTVVVMFGLAKNEGFI